MCMILINHLSLILELRERTIHNYHNTKMPPTAQQSYNPSVHGWFSLI